MTYSLRSATLRLRRALLSTVAPMVACCLMLALAACDGGPRLATLAPDATVLAFGDSLTAGKGAGRGEDYPSRLAALTGLQVINAGVSGELGGEGHERLPALLAEHRPDLVLLCHGGNDILRRNGSESMQANLRNMVHTARAAGAEVVLLAVPTLGLGLRPHPIYSDLADELDLVVENDVLTEVLSDPDLKADGVHPNAAGYAVIAERLDGLLRRLGGLD
jgi:acyl-CoA thioesterase-1